ncbi:BKACE family enzyme [Flexibacterium corallicola]|uniref:3-keto-5-aminohexanoate cleavage protein n=1 Tax=Flexibacterium corallicola TaxID=3037259 RepID=UPI00286F9727|nr:3-keto-5-aminohexanoate cleavage protein [Pseudovibrio sp. M1P-2-3]
MEPRMIMAAPNGARLQKSNIQAIPVTIEELCICARAVSAAGANALHAHVRNKAGEHVLDAGLYKELKAQLSFDAPNLVLQITTEAVGKYSPREQAKLVEEVVPEAVSVALREMMPLNGDETTGKWFYQFAKEAGIAVQHILYDVDDLIRLSQLQSEGVIPQNFGSHLYVLGRYSEKQEGRPLELLKFFDAQQKKKESSKTSFTVAAFGESETTCLGATLTLGGHVRVGFENNQIHADGRPARDNAERVGALHQLRSLLGKFTSPTKAETLKILGKHL